MNFPSFFFGFQATEALMNNQSGTKCDVWSLGVLLWETVTLGGTPFSTVATKEVAMRVARGMRLPRVPGLSDQLYQVPIIRQAFYLTQQPGFLDPGTAVHVATHLFRS